MQLILASQSASRKAQLENMGIRFQAVSPAVNEEQLKARGPTDLVELTRHLATHKAGSLSARFPDAVLIGADQLAECDGQRLDKPGDHLSARTQLMLLQGRSHRLITSLCVHHRQTSALFTDVTVLRLRPLSESEIETYLNMDKPYDCAGSYKFERAGIALIERVESQDPSAIQGLPLISLTTALLTLKFPITEWWRKS